jgi:hypothetical protein
LFLPIGDIRPPSVLDAGQTDVHNYSILFDEEILPVTASFAFSPAGITATPSAEGPLLRVVLDPEAEPGRACRLFGEVKDPAGNSTRFLFDFVGYNPVPARLRLNEVQPGKNTSASNFHRDYIELLVQEEGNLGGIQLQWTSTVKLASYTFPPCYVTAGELIVLHCAPEGLPQEKDECEDDRGLSEGVDANSQGRDFWASGGGIPDATGVIVLRNRSSGPAEDGLFFADQEKSGEVDSSKISSLLGELASSYIWECSTPALWEDALRWKNSSSKPLHRFSVATKGKEAWYIGESGSQSPGSLEPRALAAKSGRKPGEQGHP